MKTVLIIDDSDNMRFTIKEIVTRNGYKVIGEAGDGKTGVDLYKELKPDIVTMDVTMREMDGISALKEIIKHDPKANVVMVSAMGQDALVKDAIVAGAKGFIIKPFSVDQLMDVFERI